MAGLEERSRRPYSCPLQTSAEFCAQVEAVRRAHPVWGGRKIRRWLLDHGAEQVPSASTITAILRRAGQLEPADAAKHRAHQHFEHPHPNDLWQMDFKGHFALIGGGRCHPLTVLDDHSRYAIGLWACGNEQSGTVMAQLAQTFRRYGLPRRILTDNGPPWGDPGGERYTAFGVWLLRLGIGLAHGRAYHPQTQGKDERFHRTLAAEVLRQRSLSDLDDCQREFSAWREVYNYERPHEALGMVVPASRYVPSARSYPQRLPPIEYGPGAQVRKVQDGGFVHFRGRELRVGKAFRGYPVALYATRVDGRWEVTFCQQRLGWIDLRQSGERLELLEKGEGCDAAETGVGGPSVATLPPAPPPPGRDTLTTGKRVTYVSEHL